MSLHAKLQPSSASRWLSCPGSVELCANAVDTGSEYADEGTAGHAVFEALITGRAVPKVVNIDGRRTWQVTDDLVKLVEPCFEWAVQYKQTHKASIFAEQKYEIGAGFGLKPGMFWGTADFTAMSPTELCIGDLKLGYNDVPVKENKQLISYGLGALDATGWLHDRIRLVILQPRTSDEPKEVVYTADEMEAFRKEWTPGVHTAAQGGPLVASEEACKWCKAAGACPELRKYQLAMAQRDFSNLITLSGEEIAELLDKSTMIENAISSVRSHAMSLLEMDPTAVPGYKRVTGDKHRAWMKPEAEIAEKVQAYSVDPWEKSLRSPAQMEAALAEKLLGLEEEGKGPIKTKKRAKELAKAMISIFAAKPPGDPTLVKMDDARPALGPVFTLDDVKGADDAVKALPPAEEMID